MNFKKLVAFIITLSFIITFASGCISVGELPQPIIPEGSKIYDINGLLITSLYKEKRTAIKLDKVPLVTRKAIIAVEDNRFYEHHGISLIGVARAAWRNFRAGEVVEGGSTITQQTAKNLFLGHERTFDRKLRELWYALQLERQYTKDEILEMYLNQIYFGEGSYGIEEAAQTYFGKAAAELDLAESALIAGLPKAPSHYSPFVNWKAAKKRQRVVLNRMVEIGEIDADTATWAINQELVLSDKQKEPEKAPYMVNELIKYVSDNFDDGANLLFTGGLTIETTLDIDVQQAAEKVFANHLQEKDPELDGALVAIDPATGHIKALIGGRSFAASKFNRALQAKRQPGSAFKPFVFATALEQGHTAATVITCEPVEFPGPTEIYSPTDFGQQNYHYRPFTLKEALQISDNVVAVKLAEQTGVPPVVDLATKMGITSPLRPYLSLALGTSETTPLEMAAAYSPFANGGYRVKPFFVKKITDGNGRILEENKPVKTKVLDEKIAYIVTDMLKSVLAPGGTASRAGAIIDIPAAGKTGTTQNFADAWFVGYTPELVASVYLGYDTNRKSIGTTGGQLAAPLWAEFIRTAQQEKPAVDFPEPAGLIKVSLCADTGLLATPFSEKVIDAFFIDGTQPTQPCPVHFGWARRTPFNPDLTTEEDWFGFNN